MWGLSEISLGERGEIKLETTALKGPLSTMSRSMAKRHYNLVSKELKAEA